MTFLCKCLIPDKGRQIGNRGLLGKELSRGFLCAVFSQLQSAHSPVFQFRDRSLRKKIPQLLVGIGPEEPGRKILRRLHFLSEDIDLICHLVRYHMRFYCMMTDRGIRRFKSLLEYPRLIEMSRADLAAREDALTTYKHNMKYLHRAETPEQMLEPLLNGNEIMQLTKLKPGPQVGLLRDALLQAQIAGDVTDADSARAFVQDYARRSLS